MKKSFFTLFSLFLCLFTLTAQDNKRKLLNVEETTEGIGVYPCGNRHEAMVVFKTDEPFELYFESSHERPDQLEIKRDSMAGTKTYSIVFITKQEGKDFSGRRLTIKVPGFQDYRMSMNLQDKQKFEYTVSDPYSVFNSPFFTYLERAQQAFKEGEYQTARDNYELCRYCEEYKNDTTNILDHISICDSMMRWNELAIQAERFYRYHESEGYLSKMISYNTNEDLRTRLWRAQHNFNEDCRANFSRGEKLFNNGELERAEVCFKLVQENGCVELKSDCETFLIDINKARQRRDDHARTLMFAYAPNMVGLSWGSYYLSRAHGWYATLLANADDLRLLSMRPDFEKYSAAPPTDNKFIFDASFTTGPTWNVWQPIYITAGLGYRGAGYCSQDDEKLKDYHAAPGEPEDFKDFSSVNKWKYTKVNWLHAVTPEIGIVLKYGRFAIKGTYQYCYWLNREDKFQDICEKNTNHYNLGVGFCW